MALLVCFASAMRNKKTTFQHLQHLRGFTQQLAKGINLLNKVLLPEMARVHISPVQNPVRARCMRKAEKACRDDCILGKWNCFGKSVTFCVSDNVLSRFPEIAKEKIQIRHFFFETQNHSWGKCEKQQKRPFHCFDPHGDKKSRSNFRIHQAKNHPLLTVSKCPPLSGWKLVSHCCTLVDAVVLQEVHFDKGRLYFSRRPAMKSGRGLLCSTLWALLS